MKRLNVFLIGLCLLSADTVADVLTPNPAEFAVFPVPISDTEISMTAVTGTATVGSVEYYFEEISGNAGGDDSGWITSPTYTDVGLSPLTLYTYTVRMRSTPDNAGDASSARSSTTYSSQTVSWDPPVNSSGIWTSSDNWSSGSAPIHVEQYFKAVFATGREEAVLNTTASVTQMVIGDNGSELETASVRLVNGAQLTTGQAPFGNPIWTAIGYNRDARLIVEEGATLTTTGHLWIGLFSPSTGILIIDGGSVSVGQQIGLGWEGGAGIVELLAGSLHLSQMDATRSINGSSYINIEAGTLTVNGDRRSDINAYIEANKIRAYNGSSTLVVSYDSQNGETVVSALPFGFSQRPYPISETEIGMTAVVPAAQIGTVEYYFDETSGNPGGSDSGWITSATYVDTGLNAGTEYTYTVQTRTSVDSVDSASSAYVAATYLPQTINWSPVGGSDGQWTTNENWSNGIAPKTIDQYLFARIDDGQQLAMLDSTTVVAQMVIGYGGAAVESSVTLSAGAELTTGQLPFGAPVWTGVGYNQDARLTVEGGATLNTASHLWLGFRPTSTGTLVVDGGTVNVGQQFGLGWEGGTGIVQLRGGFLNLSQISAAQSISATSYINIEKGVLTIPGDERSVMNGFISANKIRANDGATTVEVDYYAETNTTRVAATSVNYNDWANAWGVNLGQSTADYDNDTLSNFAEYLFGGSPTDPNNSGFVPTTVVDNTDLLFSFVMRNDDPALNYVIEGRNDLTVGDWQPIEGILESSQSVANMPEYTTVTNRIDASSEEQYFLRLNANNVTIESGGGNTGGGDNGGGATGGGTTGGSSESSASLSSIMSLPTDLNRIEVGPMVGHTTSNSAKLWVQPKNTSDLTVYYVEENDDTAYAFSMAKEEQDDISYRRVVDGLIPSTRYDYYVVADDNAVIGSGRFKTAPAPSDDGYKYSFAFTSCGNHVWDTVQTGWTHMQSHNPDFIMYLGDTIYTNAYTKSEYARFNREAKEIPNYANVLRNFPIYTCWDDHDFGGNNTNKDSSRGGVPGNILRDISLDAFKDAWANPYSGGPSNGTYYDFTWGDVHYIVLDNRYHKTAHFGQADSKMFGDTQMQWLKDKLSTSTATFKLICTGGGYNGTSSEDFESYPTEFQELRGHIISDQIDGVLYVSGDVHTNRLRFADSGNKHFGGYPAWNIISSGIGQTNGLGRWAKVDIDTTLADPTLKVTFYHQGTPTPAWEPNPSVPFILPVTDYTFKLSDLSH